MLGAHMCMYPCACLWRLEVENSNVLVKVTIAVMKHGYQNKVGRNGSIQLALPRHSSLSKEVRTEA